MSKVKLLSFILTLVYNLSSMLSSSEFLSEMTHLEPFTKVKKDIKEGQYHYYYIKVDKKDDGKYLYITLTNTYGNTDLVVNHGKQDKPTLSNFDQRSSTFGDEFLNLQMKHTDNRVIIGVYGFANSEYKLYTTTHPNNVIPITSKASCKTKKGRFCYFSNSNVKESQPFRMIISAKFYYGQGILYSKLYSAKEIEGGKTDVNSLVINEKDEDVDSKSENFRNDLLVFVDANDKRLQPDKNFNPLQIIKVKCTEDCFFEILITHFMEKSSTAVMLNQDQENFFFLRKKKKYTFVFNKPLETAETATFNIEIKQFLGHFNTEIHTFDQSGKDLLHHKATLNPRTQFYQTTHSNFFQMKFIIHTLEVNAALFIKVNTQTEFNRVSKGFSSFKLRRQQNGLNNFKGYIYMRSIYENVVLSAKLKDFIGKAVLYGKYVIIDEKNKKDFYEYPNPNDFNFKENFDLHSITHNIDNLPKQEHKSVFFLFNIYFSEDLKAEKRTGDSSEDIGIEFTLHTKEKDDKYALTKLTSGKIIYNQLDKDDIQLYQFEKHNPKDNVFILQLSPCGANYQYKLLKSPYDSSEEYKNLNSSLSFGRYFSPITEYNRTNYVEIRRTDDENQANANTPLEYSIKYSSINTDSIRWIQARDDGVINYRFINGGEIELSWSPLMIYNIGLISHKKYEVTIDRDKHIKYHIISFAGTEDPNLLITTCQLMKAKDSNLVATTTNTTWVIKDPKVTKTNKFVINILAVLSDESDELAYMPLILTLEGNDIYYQLVYYAAGGIIILGTLFCIFNFRRKYLLSRSETEQNSDLRNLNKALGSETPRSKASGDSKFSRFHDEIN